MLFPVRCVTCNKAIGGRYKKYRKLVEEYAGKPHQHPRDYVVDSTTGEKEFKALMSKGGRTAESRALTELGILRPCCRRHFLTEIDIFDV